MDTQINKLKFNFIQDLRKKEIDIMDRAIILQSYMNENRLSFRKMSEESGIPLATLAGWISPLGFDEQTYKKMQRSGMSQADIFKLAKYKNNKKNTNKAEKVPTTKLHLVIQEVIPIVREAIHHCSFEEPEIIVDIKELQNLLNRLLMHMEMKK